MSAEEMIGHSWGERKQHKIYFKALNTALRSYSMDMWCKKCNNCDVYFEPSDSKQYQIIIGRDKLWYGPFAEEEMPLCADMVVAKTKRKQKSKDRRDAHQKYMLDNNLIGGEFYWVVAHDELLILQFKDSVFACWGNYNKENIMVVKHIERPAIECLL